MSREALLAVALALTASGVALAARAELARSAAEKGDGRGDHEVSGGNAPKGPVPAVSSVASPSNMVHIPAGSLLRGRERSTRADESPRRRVRLSAFDMDATLVTRAAFAEFVAVTGYVTSAERRGFGIAAREGMADWAWQRVPHASFRRPFIGEVDADSEAFLREDAPAVMVSHTDAVAFCAHRGARLPTEAEWEYAMRAGSDGVRYPWGDLPARDDGKLGLNFWQGVSHRKNLRLDGFVYVSPARAFPPNVLGIYDPVGNVWQWTADWYAADTYARTDADALDPKGPERGSERVLRGGSWWCGACTCEGNGLFYRGKAQPEAAFPR
jgi:formylglycine-generating enzyme required for sulfatase activity